MRHDAIPLGGCPRRSRKSPPRSAPSHRRGFWMECFAKVRTGRSRGGCLYLSSVGPRDGHLHDGMHSIECGRASYAFGGSPAVIASSMVPAMWLPCYNGGHRETEGLAMGRGRWNMSVHGPSKMLRLPTMQQAQFAPILSARSLLLARCMPLCSQAKAAATAGIRG